MSESITQLREQITQERKLLRDTLATTWDSGTGRFDPAKAKDVTGLRDIKDGDDLASEVQRLNKHIEETQGKIEQAGAVEKIRAANDEALRASSTPAGTMRHPGGGAGGAPAVKTLGSEFVAKALLDFRQRRYAADAFKYDEDPLAVLQQLEWNLARKTVMSAGAGFSPESLRTGDVVEIAAARQPTSVLDFLPFRNVTTSDVTFMRQTTRTNNAAEIAESTDGSLQSLAESAAVYTEVTEAIREIGHFIPVTEVQLEDEQQVRDLIETDLMLEVRQRLNLQVMVGNGIAPNIKGFLAAGRSPNTQAKGVESTPDAIYKGMVINEFTTGRVSPDAIMIDPADWQDVRLLTTADGVYIWGPPMDAGPERIWGLPVIRDTALTDGTALLGGFRQYSYVAIRRGVTVLASSEHASFFIQGVLAIKATMRAGLVVRRESAFTTITGI